jgi:hypothetical protein
LLDLKTDKKMSESFANRMLFCLDTRVEDNAKNYVSGAVLFDETPFLPVESTETLLSSGAMPVVKRESLRQARARMVEECEDFHALFKKLFADEHIRPTSDADMRRAEEFRNEFGEDDIADLLRQQFIESSLSADQIDRMKNDISLPEGVSWKDVVSTLHNLEQWIYYRLCHNTLDVVDIVLPAEISKPSTEELSCFVFDVGKCGEAPHMLATFEPMNVVSSVYSGYFETDLCMHIVSLRHAQVAHQVELLYHESGTQSPNLKAKSSYYYDIYKEDPPSMGTFVCLKEGLCVWNPDEERYHLVYPISAMRSLLYRCKELLLEETHAAEEEMRQFFDQELVIDYQFENHDEIAMVESHPTDFLQSVKVHMRQSELRVVSASFVASVGDCLSILRVHCIREPQWGMLVIEGRNGGNAVLGSGYEQYVYWKEQRYGHSKAREYLNYHRRRNLVVDDNLRVQLPLSTETISLRKISLQIIDRSVLACL